MCSGFFFICGLEELLHHFLHPHQSQMIEKKIKVDHANETTFSNGTKGKALHGKYKLKQCYQYNFDRHLNEGFFR